MRNGRPTTSSRSVALLLSSGADNVGGRQDAVGEGVPGRAIACAMSSPFGVGGARFRYSEREEEMPTVFLGTFRRSAFERVGPLRRGLSAPRGLRAQRTYPRDRRADRLQPRIRTRYHVRSGLAALGRQYFRYGRGKVRVARAAPGVIRPYHLAAPALVAEPLWRPRWL